MCNYLTISKLNVVVLFIFLTIFNISGQCTEAVVGFGNNARISSYNISGDVSLTLNTNNTITLDLASNFSTAAGPDIRAYLIDSNGMSDAEIDAEVHSNFANGISAFNNIQFGLVGCSQCNPVILPNGEKTFTVEIPDGVEIENYDKILFYCLRFSQFWDIGSFTPFTSNSCSVLSTEENELGSFNIFPNPAKNTIQLSNIDIEATEIRIFDFSGKKVFQQLKGNTENNIDISQLKTGIYVLSITENNKQFSQKLIVQ